MIDLPLECTCGKVRGAALGVSRENGTHVICMCVDCQAYARALGRAEDILDARGGTEIFQITPSQIRIEEGEEYLGCLRLTKKGLCRWHTTCCQTPIANTMARRKLPFAGLVLMFVDREKIDPGALDEALGPTVSIHGKSALGEDKSESPRRAQVGALFKTMRILAGGYFKKKYTPNPFMDETGAFRVEPRVLS